MTNPVTLPLWAFILVLLFAGVTFASHFLFPSVRWFLRRRAERVVAKLNERLTKPIEPFKLSRRYDMIQRLVYDPEVTKAIVEHARKEGVREDVAFEKARRYAREIVPGFSATLYFSVGARVAKWLSRFLYRLRVGQFRRDDYDAIDPDSTVVFVMNHRSNMDYVLVTYLVSRASALSYAVGEWARIWPLSPLIRMMGAYFIRRKSRGALYRRVLARYVQMATAGGVTQAVFPEGGLTLTGALAEPRLGILSYIIEDFDPNGRDVVFVPVGINYDRVLEDSVLITASKSGERRFRPPLSRAFAAIMGYLWQRLIRRAGRFGTASVSFGTPLSLTDFSHDHDSTIEAVGAELMNRIAHVLPILPSPLVARALIDGARTSGDIAAHIKADLGHLPEGSSLWPRRAPEQLARDGIAVLRARGVLSGDDTLTVAPAYADHLVYYSNSIAHHFNETPSDYSALAKQ